MKQVIELNHRQIEYELQRKPVKNLNLRIKPDGSVFLSANETVSAASIEEFLHEKTEYILKAIDYYAEIERYAPKAKQYIDGESFRVLGRDQRLVVIKGKSNSVSSDGVHLTLSVKSTDDYALKQRTMDRWLQRRCKDTIRELCENAYPKFQKYGVAFPELRYRNMVSRWGSCQPKRGVLTFNYLLIEAPVSCIEYVVVHEFTHFLCPSHSKEFYTLLSTFMPDWQERKQVLEHLYVFAE